MWGWRVGYFLLVLRRERVTERVSEREREKKKKGRKREEIEVNRKG